MSEKKNLLQTYFRGVTEKMQAEVAYITNLIEHMGERGEANEWVLRDVLMKFLPKRYAVGSGLVIDQHGHPSKQSDLIIYDNFLYPEFFGQGTPALFPVDIVYATVEIKTTLDQKEIRDSIANIASVKSLEYIKRQLMRGEPNDTGGWSLVQHETCPPLGFIFGFDTSIKMAQTVKSNIETEIDNIDKQHRPHAVFILNRSFLYVIPHIATGKADVVQAGVLARRLSNDPNQYHIVSPESLKTFKEQHGVDMPTVTLSEDFRQYPYWKVGDEYVVADPARGLLNFLLLMLFALDNKPIPPLDVRSSYLPSEFSRFNEVI